MTALDQLTVPRVDQDGPAADVANFTYVDISSIDNQAKRVVEPKVLAIGDAPSRARQRLQAGDVLVSMTRPNLNAVAIVPPALDGAVGSTGFHVLRARRKVLPEWLYFGVQTKRFIEEMSSVVQGALYPAVRPKDIRAFRLPAPPVEEQCRIVAEIEKQFSRLDEAVANLQRVKANLRRYERAVLAEAVGDQGIEPLGELPAGWMWKALPDLGELGRGKSKHRPRDDIRLYGGPFPFIQTGDVRRSGGLIKEFTQTYSEFGLAQSRLWPAGTLCITIAANIAETGILAMPACFPDSVVGFLSDDKTLTRFVEFFMRTAREDLERFAPATAQKNINLAILERVVVPVPSPAERDRIVAEVDRRLSIVREVETEVDMNLKRAQALRQSVLQAAFACKLPA
ncbi:MAG: restriction endonuclease subunit S [Rubrivivax sp.]|nr:restriction endonuclease subunit S [Rubrivivax sp.]